MFRSRGSKGIKFPGKEGRVTDNDWFSFLSQQPGIDEVNFWEPGARSRFQALIELGASGSEERSILENITNHLKGRGVSVEEKQERFFRYGVLDMIGLAILKNEWKYHAIAWYNHAI